MLSLFSADTSTEQELVATEVWVMVASEQPFFPLEEGLVSRRLLDGVGGEYNGLVMAADGLELIGGFELDEGVDCWGEWRLLPFASCGEAGSC